MLKFLRKRASDRKVRLFACACCRRIWKHLALPMRRAVDAAEGFADGVIGAPELQHRRMRAVNSAHFSDGNVAACWAANARRKLNEQAPFEVVKDVAGRAARTQSSARWKRARDTELRSQAELLRCLIGNPFRPVAFSPSWRTSTAVALAQQMYDSREFSALPILADALQDAGCDDEDVLQHCRGPGAHARGCWVVDGVLGK
jgi:hypothetical protein